MKLRQRLVLPTAALAVSTPFLALGMGGGGGGGSSVPTEYAQRLDVGVAAASGMTGAFGRTVVLNADGDGRLDAAALVGDAAVLLFAPDIHQVSRRVDGAATNDIDVLPGVDGEQDRILTVGAEGLVAASFNSQAGAGFNLEVLEVGAWIGASEVYALDFEGDGDADVVGLDAARQQVLRMVGAPGEVFSPAPAVDLDGAATRLTPVAWFGGGQHCLAVLTGDEVKVMEDDGTLRDSFQLGRPGIDLVRLRESGTSVEALAVLVGDASDARIVVLREGGIVEEPVVLGTAAPTRLGVADLDSNGDDDLLLNSTTSNGLLYLVHQGPLGTSFSVEEGGFGVIEVAPLDADMSGQRANPVGADFDRDGDVDVFQLVETTRVGRMKRSFLRNETQHHVSFDGASFQLEQIVPRIELSATVPVLPSGGDASEVEFEVWATRRAGDIETTNAYMLGRSSVSIAHPDAPVACSVDLPTTVGRNIWLHLRPIHRDATGAISEYGVDSVFAYERTLAEGGGGGGADPNGTGQGGDGGTPPPPPPPPGGAPHVK